MHAKSLTDGHGSEGGCNFRQTTNFDRQTGFTELSTKLRIGFACLDSANSTRQRAKMSDSSESLSGKIMHVMFNPASEMHSNLAHWMLSLFLNVSFIFIRKSKLFCVIKCHNFLIRMLNYEHFITNRKLHKKILSEFSGKSKDFDATRHLTVAISRSIFIRIIIEMLSYNFRNL